MRINIQTTANEKFIRFNYQPKMVGTIHKWLGLNDLHGRISLYSFSWLMNAVPVENGLNYPFGAKFFISFYEKQYVKQLVQSIMQDPEMFFGLTVKDLSLQEDPDLSERTLFRCASPVFLRYASENIDKYYTFEDPESSKLLTEKLQYKMELAGLPKDESLKIRFAPEHVNARIKLVDYNGVKHKVSQCPVIIEGKPESKIFAWHVGLGNSTGIGYGAIE